MVRRQICGKQHLGECSKVLLSELSPTAIVTMPIAAELQNRIYALEKALDALVDALVKAAGREDG